MAPPPPREVWVIEREHREGVWLPLLNGVTTVNKQAAERALEAMKSQYTSLPAGWLRVARYVPVEP